MKIIFRADGFTNLGLGHIYNCMTLAFAMKDCEILMVTRRDAKQGLMKLEETGLPIRTIDSDTELDGIIREFCPDVWVNDCLNTTAPYIRHLRKLVPRVVTIEDLGEGAKEADAVINAVYPGESKDRHIYNGHAYVCLREEFQETQPNAFSRDVRNIIVMFGGTDPSNLNRVVYPIAEKLHGRHGGIMFQFITGIGYDHEKNGIVTDANKNIFVYPNVKRVTDYMKKADLAITGQGRTIFEVAAMGIPTVVLSQNERETMHEFARMENGFINLGIGKQVRASLIENTLEWLIEATPVRRNMYELMLKHSLRAGLVRVVNIIKGEDYG